MARKATEAEIQRSICDYLTRRNVFFWRQNNTGKMPGGRYVSVTKGVSDIIAIHAGTAYFIEVKAEDGKPSDEQLAFGKRAIQAGAEYRIVRSIDDVQALGL